MGETRQGIPVFGLYGDGAVPTLVHVEHITFRAPQHGWDIAAHRHASLSQALLVTTGGGRLSIDAAWSDFAAPWLVWVPAGVVHAYEFTPGTDGYVVSVTDALLSAAVEHDPDAALLRGATDSVFSGRLATAEEIAIDLERVAMALLREATGPLPGSAGAATGLVKLILVGLLRTRALRAIAEPAVERSALYRRYRRLVEEHLRENWSVGAYAAALHVTADRLHAACVEACGRPPRAVLHDRLIVEAKRMLAYTAQPVAEVAFGLGFSDPAYFSRFFAQRAGMSAAAFRRSISASAGLAD